MYGIPLTTASVSVLCPQCGTRHFITPNTSNAQIVCSLCGYTFSVTIPQAVFQMQPQIFSPYGGSPYFPMHASQPGGAFFSWELFPQFYGHPPKRRKSGRQQIRIAGLLLAVATCLSIIAVGLLAFAPVLYGFEGNASLTGKVSEGTFLTTIPVSNANVSLDNGTIVLTDTYGNFYFPNVKSGEHTVSIEKQGYMTYIVTIFLINGISDKIDIATERGEGLIILDQRQYADWTDAYSYFYGNSIIILILSAFGLAGAYFTLKRKVVGVSIAGAFFQTIIAIFYIDGFIALSGLLAICSILGIISLFIIIIYRRSFEGYGV